MKKIVVALLCLCMLFSMCTGYAANVNTDKIVSELQEFTPEDRANMMAIALPMILTDSGLDLATDLIINYDPESNSTYNSLLHPVFKVITQEEALAMVAQMYKIDESLRIKYFEGFQNRIPAELSTSSKAAITRFFETEIAQVDGLQQICTEDGITPEVLACFCGLFVELNDNAALLTDKNETDFKVNTVSSLLNEIMLGASDSEVSANSSVENLANRLNTEYSAAEKRQLKKALREIGLYTPSSLYSDNGVTGGGVTGDGDSDETQTGALNGFGYKITEHSEENGDTLETHHWVENGNTKQ